MDGGGRDAQEGTLRHVIHFPDAQASEGACHEVGGRPRPPIEGRLQTCQEYVERVELVYFEFSKIMCELRNGEKGSMLLFYI